MIIYSEMSSLLPKWHIVIMFLLKLYLNLLLSRNKFSNDFNNSETLKSTICSYRTGQDGSLQLQFES